MDGVFRAEEGPMVFDPLFQSVGNLPRPLRSREITSR